MDFAACREITSATDIPRLGWTDRIGLLRVQSTDEPLLVRAGATKGLKGWTIGRSSHVRLDLLEGFLPRFAKRRLIPDVVDLIPETSWCASLANILAPGSWKLLRETATIHAGGCEECGARDRLECHEAWHYDDASGTQTLVRLRSLCGPCHETCHLGFASVRGRYAQARDRLVRINRVEPHEIIAFEDQIFGKFQSRSRREWTLNLSVLKGYELRLKRSFQIETGGKIRGEGKSGNIVAALSGIRVEPTSQGLQLS